MDMQHPFTDTQTPVGLRSEWDVAETGFYGIYRKTPLKRFVPERHSHDFYEFYIHLQGAQYYSVENELADAHANQLIIIPPFCMHGPVWDRGPAERDDIAYERAYLYVKPETLAAAGGDIIALSERIRQATANGNCFFSLTQEEAERCRECIVRIETKGQTAGAVDRFDAYVCVLTVLQVVLHAIRDVPCVPGRPEQFPFAQQVMRYLDEHCTQAITLSGIARHFHVSVSYLSHTFSQAHSHSIYDYVLYRRSMLACGLIRQGESLTGVAYRCGFNSYTAFARTFKKYIGISPREYRTNGKSGAGNRE